MGNVVRPSPRWGTWLCAHGWVMGSVVGLFLSSLFRADALEEAAIPAFEYGLRVFTSPRPLRVHWVSLAIKGSAYEVVPLVGEDPDGEGPAEALLTAPEVLMERGGAVAAVNASAFQVLPGTRLQDGGWHEGRPVLIAGWIVRGGRVLSPMDGRLEQFWVADDGRAGFGRELPPAEGLRWAVGTHASDTGLILSSGQVTVGTSRFATDRHPRTALGLDATRTRLWLIVVDGRAPGYSEGVSLAELAGVCRELGCQHTLNLDGGGSSILMLADENGRPRVMNRPSDGKPRPVPVLLGVRAKPKEVP